MSIAYKNKFKAKHTLVKLGVFALLKAACGGAIIDLSEDYWIKDVCMGDEYEILCEMYHDPGNGKGYTNMSLHIIDTLTGISIPISVSFYSHKIDLINLCEFSDFGNDFWKKVVAETPNSKLGKEVGKKAEINLAISPFNSKLEMKNFDILGTFVGEYVSEERGGKAEYEIYYKMKHSSRSSCWTCVILMLIRSLIYGND